jgi:hypothetical protein
MFNFPNCQNLHIYTKLILTPSKIWHVIQYYIKVGASFSSIEKVELWFRPASKSSAGPSWGLNAVAVEWFGINGQAGAVHHRTATTEWRTGHSQFISLFLCLNLSFLRPVFRIRIRIQLVAWIRIRIPNADPNPGQKRHKKYKNQCNWYKNVFFVTRDVPDTGTVFAGFWISSRIVDLTTIFVSCKISNKFMN